MQQLLVKNSTSVFLKWIVNNQSNELNTDDVDDDDDEDEDDDDPDDDDAHYDDDN